MKCTGISTGSSSEDKMTIEEFIGSPHAKSRLGQLLIELTQEAAWSCDYTIYGSFGNSKHFLQAHHRMFLEAGPIVIYEDGEIELSVRGVEDAVVAYLDATIKGLAGAANLLLFKRDDLQRMARQIVWDKAKGAVLRAFPEATELRPVHPLNKSDLFAFSCSSEWNKEPLLVARAIRREFIGGVVEVVCTKREWSMASAPQQHHVFFAALAREFAARELAISTADLLCEEVIVSEKPREPRQADPVVVERVTLKYVPLGTSVKVLFNDNNLPCYACYFEQELAAKS